MAKDSHKQDHAAETRSDEELMHAYCGGEVPAFATLVHRHERGVFAFLLRSVHNKARAEELLQEVFLRVIRSRDRYQETAKFGTWLYTIARNLCVDESRRARFRRHQSLDATRPDSDRGSLLERTAAQEVPTDDAADAGTLRQRIAAAVERLPEDQREVFLMRQIGQLSFKEIAQSVGASENTVKSRMRYALEKLRGELDDLDPLPKTSPRSTRELAPPGEAATPTDDAESHTSSQRAEERTLPSLENSKRASHG